jgi:hypothetical protein
MIWPGYEDRIWCTFQTSEDICPKVIDWADEVFIPHEQVCHEHPKNDGTDPSTHKTFHSLLGRKLYQLSAAEGDTADISEDVVRNNKTNWQEEPDHTLEDIVHNEMGQNHDEEQSHVRPSELRELESIVAFPQRADEEDEACESYQFLSSG